MKAARHKRLLLGILAVLAPLPLPLNEPRPDGVIGFPALALFVTAVVYFLFRAHRDAQNWLKPWMLNLVGALYLPFLAIDVSLLWRGSLVRPMMHLALFALLMKLFSLRSEIDKWHALIGLFFVFVTGVATSTHPAIVVYLGIWSALGLLVLTRFAYFHLRDLHEQPGRLVLGPRSVKRYVAAATAAVALVAIPLFALLPRFHNPYIMGNGGDPSAAAFGLGFSDTVTLDVVGRVRSSREVALRAGLDGNLPTSEFRFKGAAYDGYAGTTWERSEQVETLRPRSGKFVLAAGVKQANMHIWLRPLRARSLILPVEALAVELEVPAMRRSAGGGIVLPHRPASILEYDVAVADTPAPTSNVPDLLDRENEPSLDQTGVSERIRELAATVAGDGSPSTQARRIEGHLITEYEYTLDFLRREADSPVEDFLFEYRSGHCEYFASAMVLMLRARGIPARFVTGFLGAEYNPIENYYVVRQSNAHAWVEAWIEGEGWRIYDPTPPAGRPLAADPSLRLVLRQAWDWVLFRWDRYIISFGAVDQMELLRSMRDRLVALLRGDSGVTDAVGARAANFRSRGVGSTGVTLLGLGFLVLWGLGLWWTKPRPTATRAFARLRREAARRGIAADASVTPTEVHERVVSCCPESREPCERLLTLYLLESYRGDRLALEQCREAKRALRETTHRLRKAS